MNKKMTWAVAGMAVVLSVGIMAAKEKPSEDFVKAMKAVNAANGQLRAHVTAKDFDGIAADATALKASFDVTAKYWTEKKVEDATKMNADVSKAIADLATAAKAKNEEGIAAAQKAIGGSCMGCHTAHRSARMPDGTYEIK